jgi:hypothetical protein
MTLQHAETIHSMLKNPAVLITFVSVLLNSELAFNVLYYSTLAITAGF